MLAYFIKFFEINVKKKDRLVSNYYYWHVRVVFAPFIFQL
jgi:hypothetical protein